MLNTIINIIILIISKAILYAWGGMYMDDDANFGIELDKVIEDSDKLILGILRKLYKRFKFNSNTK